MPARNALRRRLLYTVGRLLQPILSRTHVTGRENIPKTGGLIVVGNHSAYIEALLMILTMPAPIDLLASTDVPLRGSFTFLQNWYGFIGINRGEIDRVALKASTDVLKAGGRIAIFPEGGIWDKHIGDARLGVAYLSQQTQTPILPMGFGGLIGAINKITHFKRPILTVNVGPVLPPVPTSENYRERKALAQAASNKIMEAIYALVPADDEVNQMVDRQEAYVFAVQLSDAGGQPVAVPSELAIPYGEDLSYFFHRPILISVVIDNLARPAEALRHFATEHDPAKFVTALDETLKVYTQEKPAFLNYRLGNQRAAHVVDALRAFRNLAAWASAQGASMHIEPQATFTYADGQVAQLAQPEAAHDV